MAETRDPLAALAEEEAAELAAIDAAHEAEQEERRAAEAEARAAADAGEEPEGDEDDGDEGELEEPKLYAGKYESVEEMERAYLEAQSTIGRLGNEVGQIRKMVEQQSSGGRAAAPAQGQELGPDGQPLMSKEELDEWMVQDPVGATFYLAQLAAAAQAAETQQMLQPVMQTVNNNAAASALEQVKRELGPDGEQLLATHREALIAAMEADRDHFVSPETRVRHMKEAVLAAAWESGNLPTRDSKPRGGRRRDSGRTVREDVHVEGGSGAAPGGQRGVEQKLTPEEEELAQLDPVSGWKRPVDEKGIPLPIGPLA